MATPNIKAVLEAIGLLKGADPDLVKALSDDADLAKATSVGPAAASVKEIVLDHWKEGHTNAAATKEEIKTGPVQESSGGGAERMTGMYSNPVKQEHGVASTPEKLERMLGSLESMMKSMTDSNAAIKSLLIALVKGDGVVAATKADPAPAVKKGEDEEDEEDEESEVVEINESKAKSFLLRAQALIKKAKKAEAKAKDMKDDEKADCMGKAKSYREEAAILLGKARTCAYAAGSVELKKSIRAIASKSDINVVEEEEEEDDEEEEDGKSKAKKAVTDIAGNQADHMDPKNGNQAGEAAKSTADADTLRKAVDGIAILQTTVSGMMDVLSGKSRVSDLVPNISKAKVEDIESIPSAIDDAEDVGTLSRGDAFAARDIYGKLELVKAGKIDASIVTDRLVKTSPAIRALFANKLTVAA